MGMGLLVYSQHLAGIKRLEAEGFFTWGGTCTFLSPPHISPPHIPLSTYTPLPPLHFPISTPPLTPPNPGAFFGAPPQEGQTPSFKGSIMLALGETKDDVVAVLKTDPYTVGDVWDWEKVS